MLPDFRGGKIFKMDTKEWLEENPTLKKFKSKHPALAGFFGKRLSKNKPYGLKFTGGLLLSFVLFFIFLEITFDVIAKEVSATDMSIMNFVYIFRNLSFAKYFLFFTDIGDWQGVVIFGIVFILFLLMMGKRREAIFSSFTLLFGEMSYALIKIIIARPRPSIFYSLVPRSGFSFPSGHSVGSMVFYGFTGYLIMRMLKKRSLKYLVLIATAVIILSIGFSRIYLGVHWTSDVLGGWTLGLSIAVFSAFLLKEAEGKRPRDEKPVFDKKYIYLLTAVLFVLSASFVFYFYRYNPLEYKASPPAPNPVFLGSGSSLYDLISENGFPRFSQSIAGTPMEPMSFVVIGSKESLVAAFEKEGWVVADPPTTSNFIKLGIAALTGSSYPAAPASPSFLNAEPQLLTFEKDVGGTFKVRHHTRFWRTNFYYGGSPVWVASASFDEGLQKYLIYHKISPDIDTERDYINNDLMSSGFLASEIEIQFVKPMMGHNFAGDVFFTNGKAYIITLR